MRQCVPIFLGISYSATITNPSFSWSVPNRRRLSSLQKNYGSSVNPRVYDNIEDLTPRRVVPSEYSPYPNRIARTWGIPHLKFFPRAGVLTPQSSSGVEPGAPKALSEVCTSSGRQWRIPPKGHHESKLRMSDKGAYTRNNKEP